MVICLESPDYFLAIPPLLQVEKRIYRITIWIMGPSTSVLNDNAQRFFSYIFFLFLHLLQLEQIWNKFIFLFESLVKIKTQVGKGSSSKSKSIGPHQSLFFYLLSLLSRVLHFFKNKNKISSLKRVFVRHSSQLVNPKA